jgi:hypothetical protein
MLGFTNGSVPREIQLFLFSAGFDFLNNTEYLPYVQSCGTLVLWHSRVNTGLMTLARSPGKMSAILPYTYSPNGSRQRHYCMVQKNNVTHKAQAIQEI